MTLFDPLVGKNIFIMLSGEIRHKGLLIDVSNELLVIYSGKDFIYVPVHHIQKVLLDDEAEQQEEPDFSPFDELDEGISIRKLLTSAKGVFVELQISKNQVIHGYVTNVLNDYFAFHSPIYQTLFISFQHLKSLIPYEKNQIPFGLELKSLPVKPSQISLARSLEEQLRKSAGKLIVFDLGETPAKIGKLEKVENQIIKLTTARENSTLLSLKHIKTVHFPSE